MSLCKRLVLATAICALGVTGSASAASAPRIVGGSAIPITSAPWQVLVNIDLHNGDAEFCGGVILDATHVLTAAHCVHQDDQAPHSALFNTSWFTVAAGTTNLYPFNPAGGSPPIDSTGSLVGVSAIAPDTRWDSNDFDEAVLTLSTPLVLDGTYRRAATLGTVTPPIGTQLTVSGWGLTNPNVNSSVSTQLLRTTVSVSDFNTCNSENNGLFKQATVICAFTQGQDACAGDSGGPLVDAGGTLIGIVSTGPTNCGVGASGVYASVTDCRVRAFITAQYVGGGPQPCTPPTLAGAPAIGQTLTCNNGTWTGSPTFTYTFVNQAGNVDLQTGPSNTYLITNADGNRTISCRVTAQDATGTGSAVSNAIGPIPMPKDTTAPRATISSHKCTRTQCIVKITVSDSNYTIGSPTIRVTRHTTTTRKCTVKGKKKTCSHTGIKLLTSKRTSTGFTVTASKLPYGKHRFYVTATDASGNKQSAPTTATSYTHAPKKK